MTFSSWGIPLLLAGGVIGSGATVAQAVGPAAGVAGEAAAGAIAGELLAMAKGSKYAGLVKGRANDQPDTDSDTIGWLAYHTLGPEFQINLSLDINDQRARSYANINYQVPIKGTWDAWLLGSTKGYFISKDYYATAGVPQPGDDNPQYAFVEWGIAMDGETVFGPYRQEAGRDPFAPASSKPSTGSGMSGPTNDTHIAMRRVADMAPASGTMSLHVQLKIVSRLDGQAMVIPVQPNAGLFTQRLTAGFMDNVPPGVDPFPGTPGDIGDLNTPASFTSLYDAHFIENATWALVPLANGSGSYSDAQLLQMAAEQLYGFETGRTDATTLVTVSLDNLAQGTGDVTLDASFSVPFTHSSWESDRTFYCPDWDYWVPLIEAGSATIDEAWNTTLAELAAMGISTQTANYHANLSLGFDSAEAVPEPAWLGLVLTPLGVLLTRRRRP